MRKNNAISFANMEQAWARSVEETCKFFNVDESKGYSDEQVKRAQEKYGPNGKWSYSSLLIS